MPYDPSLGPNLQLWVEDSLMFKDAGITPCAAPGDVVSQWDDHSAGAHHLSEIVGHPPVYETPVINGKPVARGNGVNLGLSHATLMQGWTDFTVFVVWQPSASITAYERLLDINFGADLSICRNASSANRWGAFVAGQFASHFPTITLADGSPHILCVHRSGSTLTVFGDGETNQASDAGCSTAATAASPLGIMAAYNGGAGGSGTNGDLAALVIRDAALSATDRANDWTYLATKYGITLSGVGSPAPVYAAFQFGTNYWAFQK